MVPVKGTGLRCLELAGGRTLWERDDCRALESACFVAGGYAFARAEFDGEVQRTTVFELETGAEARTLEMFCEPSGIYEIEGSLVVHFGGQRVRLDDLSLAPAGEVDGIIYQGKVFGSPAEGPACWDAATEAPVWAVTGEGERELPLSCADEVLVLFRFGGEICVRAAADGRLLWSRPTQHMWDIVRPYLIGGDLVIGWEGWDLNAFRADTGELIWTHAGRGEPSNVVRTGDLVWFGAARNANSFLYALEAESGKQVAAHKVKARFDRYSLSVLDDALVCKIGRKLTCYRTS